MFDYRDYQAPALCLLSPLPDPNFHTHAPHSESKQESGVLPIDHLDKKPLPKTSFKTLGGSKNFNKMLYSTECFHLKKIATAVQLVNYA